MIPEWGKRVNGWRGSLSSGNLYVTNCGFSENCMSHADRIDAVDASKKKSIAFISLPSNKVPLSSTD